MSLIDRVRHLAGGCSVNEARAVVAEVYRHVGEGALVSRDPENAALVLLDNARALLQANAAADLPDVQEATGYRSVVDGEVHEGAV